MDDTVTVQQGSRTQDDRTQDDRTQDGWTQEGRAQDGGPARGGAVPQLVDGCRALVTRALPRRRPQRMPYGWHRICAGAALLDTTDPGWWREDEAQPVDVATLNMADPYTCVLGQRFAWLAGLCPQPYEAGLLALGVPPGDAAGYGFTGVDADLLTAGWRHLITTRRAQADSACGQSGVASAPRLPVETLSPAAGLGERAEVYAD